MHNSKRFIMTVDVGDPLQLLYKAVNDGNIKSFDGHNTLLGGDSVVGVFSEAFLKYSTTAGTALSARTCSATIS